jgi:hypothetical protein
MAKKSWVRSKEQIIICGKCEVCNKELTLMMGGWIVNAEKKRFCHNGIDELCFENTLIIGNKCRVIILKKMEQKLRRVVL